MFKMAEALLDPEVAVRRRRTSTLHQTHSWKDEDLYDPPADLLRDSTTTAATRTAKHDGLSRYAPLQPRAGARGGPHRRLPQDGRSASASAPGWLKYGCTPRVPSRRRSLRHRPALAHLRRRPRARLPQGWGAAGCGHRRRRCALRPRHHHHVTADGRHHCHTTTSRFTAPSSRARPEAQWHQSRGDCKLLWQKYKRHRRKEAHLHLRIERAKDEAAKKAKAECASAKRWQRGGVLGGAREKQRLKDEAGGEG